jgi:hypothetical protein
MASPNPIAELAQRCVERLEASRAAGVAYPMPLNQLLDAAAAPGTTYSLAQRSRAVKHAAFRQRCYVAHPRHPDAPVALVEDREALAVSPQLFQFACRYTSGGPPWLAADLKKAVAKPLHAAFEQALRSRATAVESATLVAFSADERLLLQILGALGLPASTPFPTLRQLAERAGLSPLKLAPKLKKLVSSDRFLAQATPLLEKHLESPIAARADADTMARRTASLELLLRAARTDKKRLVARKDLLKKAAAAVRPNVQAFVDEQLAAGGPLGAVAAIRDGKDLKFFLLEDLEPDELRWRLKAASVVPTTAPAASTNVVPTDVVPMTAPMTAKTGAASADPMDDLVADLAVFAAQLAAAFERLDGESGRHNQVSLRQLRAALPTWERAAFDLRLSRLRQAGDYTLSGMQHRGGLSAEDQEAGIREGGLLRIYVSRLRGRETPPTGPNS